MLDVKEAAAKTRPTGEKKGTLTLLSLKNFLGSYALGE
jgi:hypothetical protein